MDILIFRVSSVKIVCTASNAVSFKLSTNMDAPVDGESKVVVSCLLIIQFLVA